MRAPPPVDGPDLDGGRLARRARGPLALLSLGAFALSLCPTRSFDTPWVVAAGQVDLAARRLLAHDPFSYTQAVPWMHHEWLTEIALALVHRAGGFAGLGLLAALSSAATVLALFWPRAGRAPRVMRDLSLLAPAIATLALRETVEPVAQLFSNVLFALFLRLLADGPAAATRRLAIGVLALQLVWTQFHGGNPTGVALLVAWACASRSWAVARARSVLLATAAALTCAGPYGARVHTHFFAHRAGFAAVREFQPLSAALASGSLGHALFVGLVLVAATALVVRWRAARARPARDESLRFEAVALALFAAVTVAHVRLATETALVAAFALAPSLRLLSDRAARALSRPALVAASALAAIALAASITLCVRHLRPLGLGLDESRFPVAAVRFLDEARPPGPMWNGYNFGGYLLYARPSEPVFVDGRAFTVYSDEQIAGLVRLYEEPSRFPALERRYGFRLAVLPAHGKSDGLRAFLLASGRWRPAYEDGVASILVRAD